MTLREKLFEPDESDRAVSPVIGVILMVAITVILAATIGAFVLGFTDQNQTTPRAGVSFSESSGDVSVTLSSSGNLESNTVTVNKCNGDDVNITGVGSSITDGSCDDGDTITVRGTSSDGTEGVVAQYEYEE